jgi:hypothetical protein
MFWQENVLIPLVKVMKSENPAILIYNQTLKAMPFSRHVRVLLQNLALGLGISSWLGTNSEPKGDFSMCDFLVLRWV